MPSCWDQEAGGQGWVAVPQAVWAQCCGSSSRLRFPRQAACARCPGHPGGCVLHVRSGLDPRAACLEACLSPPLRLTCCCSSAFLNLTLFVYVLRLEIKLSFLTASSVLCGQPPRLPAREPKPQTAAEARGMCSGRGGGFRQPGPGCVEGVQGVRLCAVWRVPARSLGTTVGSSQPLGLRTGLPAPR